MLQAGDPVARAAIVKRRLDEGENLFGILHHMTVGIDVVVRHSASFVSPHTLTPHGRTTITSLNLSHRGTYPGWSCSPRTARWASWMCTLLNLQEVSLGLVRQSMTWSALPHHAMKPRTLLVCKLLIPPVPLVFLWSPNAVAWGPPGEEDALVYWAVLPPSITSSDPVMKDDSSEARYR